MATRKTKGGTKTKKTKKTGTKKREPLALQILAKDHKLVGGMFKRFERLDEDDVAEKETIMREICNALTVHAMVEEEIFYRELRGAIEEDEESLDEATVEHASLKSLIGQLENADVEDELVCAKVKVLGEYVKHHVAEEEGQIFKQARKAKSKGLDLDEMGERMQARKEQLEEAVEHTAMHDRPSARPQKGGRPAHAAAAH